MAQIQMPIVAPSPAACPHDNTCAVIAFPDSRRQLGASASRSGHHHGRQRVSPCGWAGPDRRSSGPAHAVGRIRPVGSTRLQCGIKLKWPPKRFGPPVMVTLGTIRLGQALECLLMRP